MYKIALKDNRYVSPIPNGRFRTFRQAQSYIKRLRRRCPILSVRATKERVTIADLLSSIVEDIPIMEWECVPDDLSKNLDHYLYGSNKSLE